MEDPLKHEITGLLGRIKNGDEFARHELSEVVYEKLRQIAGAHMRRQQPGHTLQPTALVNEAWMKLFGESECNWVDRRHFFNSASGAMRKILVDHARAQSRLKRKPNGERVPLEGLVAAFSDRAGDLAALDDELSLLEERNKNLAEVVSLRFFAGLPVSEIAQLTQQSQRSIERALAKARALLRTRLDGPPND